MPGMATLSSKKIGSVASVAPGATHTFVWNNPPWGGVVSYVAFPVPPNPSGPHGAASGRVAVTRVEFVSVIDHYNGDSKQAHVDVLNTGTESTGFDLFENWVS
jgi:hypothetical protein